MLVRALQPFAGANFSYIKGDVADVPEETAQSWIEHGLAEEADPVVKQPEVTIETPVTAPVVEQPVVTIVTAVTDPVVEQPIVTLETTVTEPIVEQPAITEDKNLKKTK